MYFTTHTKKCLGPETERTEYYKKLRPPVSHLLFRCGAFLKVKVSVAQSCLTLCVPMDCSLPGSSVHGLSQVGILEWVAIPSSRGSSQSRDRAWVSHITGRFFTVWATSISQVCTIWRWCACLASWELFLGLRMISVDGGARMLCLWLLLRELLWQVPGPPDLTSSVAEASLPDHRYTATPPARFWE